MQRAEVRIVEPQQVQSQSSDVNNYEAQALLAKYGYGNIQQTNPQPQNPSNFLTAEEMFNQQQREMEQEKARRSQMNTNRAYSFDRDQIGYSETKYASMDDFGIKVQIVSTMPINR